MIHIFITQFVYPTEKFTYTLSEVTSKIFIFKELGKDLLEHTRQTPYDYMIYGHLCMSMFIEGVL